MVPVAVPSLRYAPEAFESVSVSVSRPLVMRVVEHRHRNRLLRLARREGQPSPLAAV